MKQSFCLEVSVPSPYPISKNVEIQNRKYLALIVKLLNGCLRIISIVCPMNFFGKFKSIVIVGRSWSDGSEPTTVDSSQVAGGSLATEGVRTALAQLLNLHGMHVNGLESIGSQPSNQNSGGKWY